MPFSPCGYMHIEYNCKFNTAVFKFCELWRLIPLAIFKAESKFDQSVGETGINE